MEILVSFLISIAASVIANYICKWLDSDRRKKQATSTKGRRTQLSCPFLVISLIEICVIVLILYTTIILLSIYQVLLLFYPLDLTFRFVGVLSVTFCCHQLLLTQGNTQTANDYRITVWVRSHMDAKNELRPYVVWYQHHYSEYMVILQ